MPDNTPDANRMCLPISNQPPGFKTPMLRFAGNTVQSNNFVSNIFTGKPSGEEWLAITDYHFSENDIVVHQYGSDVEEHFNVATVVFVVNPERPLEVQNGYLVFETSNHILEHENPDKIKALIEKKYIF